MPEQPRVRTVRLIPVERHTRKPYVAAYIRVSSKKGRQDESYEAQAAYYENLIRSNPEWDFVGVYGDKQSGTRADNRVEFQRMIQDALAGKIDLIICKSASRWSRNIVDGLDAIRLLTGNRVYIIIEQENIDTRQPGSVMLLNLSMAIAQTESEPLEPIHVHISEGKASPNATKIWITSTGKACRAREKIPPI